LIIIAGVRIVLVPPLSAGLPDSQKHTFSSAFVLTITNPTLLVTFSALFAALKVHGESGNYLKSLIAVLAVFIGSLVWWVGAVWLVDLFRENLAGARLVWINRLTGVLVTVLGLLALLLIH